MNTYSLAARTLAAGALAVGALTVGSLLPGAPADAAPRATPRLTAQSTTPPAAQAAAPRAARRGVYPEDLGLIGRATHRRPVPGEVQQVRWTVRDHGSRPVSEVDLDATVPAGWRLRDDAGCARLGNGRLRCVLGPLSPGQAETVRFVLVVPRHPAFGTETYGARTRFTVDEFVDEGPSASMRVRIVPRRLAPHRVTRHR